MNKSFSQVAVGTALLGIPMAGLALYFSLQRGEQPYITIAFVVLVASILLLIAPIGMKLIQR